MSLRVRGSDGVGGQKHLRSLLVGEEGLDVSEMEIQSGILGPDFGHPGGDDDVCGVCDASFYVVASLWRRDLRWWRRRVRVGRCSLRVSGRGLVGSSLMVGMRLLRGRSKVEDL